MRTRSELLALVNVPPNHRTERALRQGDIAKATWHAGYTFDRIDDLERERAEIRKIVRRYNRRWRRMTGQDFKNA